jgi:hypothetical protein
LGAPQARRFWSFPCAVGLHCCGGDPMNSLISKRIKLRELIALMDDYTWRQVNPVQLRPHLEVAVGKRRADLMWTAACVFIAYRDTWRLASQEAEQDMSPLEGAFGGLAIICLIAAGFDGSDQRWLWAAGTFGTIALGFGIAETMREAQR